MEKSQNNTEKYKHRNCPLCDEKKENDIVLSGTNLFCRRCHLIYNSELRIIDAVQHWENFTLDSSTRLYDISKIFFYIFGNISVKLQKNQKADF